MLITTHAINFCGGIKFGNGLTQRSALACIAELSYGRDIDIGADLAFPHSLVYYSEIWFPGHVL
jgi:hypothetical protein